MRRRRGTPEITRSRRCTPVHRLTHIHSLLWESFALLVSESSSPLLSRSCLLSSSNSNGRSSSSFKVHKRHSLQLASLLHTQDTFPLLTNPHLHRTFVRCLFIPGTKNHRGRRPRWFFSNLTLPAAPVAPASAPSSFHRDSTSPQGRAPRQERHGASCPHR